MCNIDFVKKKTSVHLIRWGIIGTGNMAKIMSFAIDKNSEGVVHAVASRTIDKAKAFANEHPGCIAYGSYEDIVEDDNIDVFYIATPITQHYENVKLCIAHGRNVLCEKPFMSNEEQVSELIELAQKNGCFLMEGMWMKCLPVYRKALDLVSSGVIGNVELIRVDFYKMELVNQSLAVFNREQGGGVLNNYGIYALSFPLGFIGQGDILVDSKVRNSIYDIDSDWLIYMKRGDVQAFVNISSDFNSSSKAAIIGSNGTIVWESQFNRTDEISVYGVDGHFINKYKFTYESEGFEYEIDEVQDCLKRGANESLIVPWASSRLTMAIHDLLKEKDGKSVIISNRI